MGEGLEAMEDPEQSSVVRAQATRVLLKSFVAACLVMIGLLLLP